MFSLAHYLARPRPAAPSGSSSRPARVRSGFRFDKWRWYRRFDLRLRISKMKKLFDDKDYSKIEYSSKKLTLVFEESCFHLRRNVHLRRLSSIFGADDRRTYLYFRSSAPKIGSKIAIDPVVNLIRMPISISSDQSST